MVMFTFLVASVNIFAFSVKISNLSSSKWFKMLVKIILDFDLSILNFRFDVLMNYFFLFHIFFDVFQKSFIFSVQLLFRIWLKKTSWYIVIGIISIFFIDIVSTRNKNALGCVWYLGKNVIEFFIILNKTLCFSIHEQPKIMVW